MRRNNLLWSVIIWTILVLISFFWNFSQIISNNKEVVLNKAQGFFDQVISTRAWNSMHGGVYVEVTNDTKPNPYLKIKNREVTTTGGMVLTKINPSYMTRQIAEINKSRNDIQLHITSLKPIRPANSADAWEKKSLISFEKGEHEILELVNLDSTLHYRYMAPLITQQSCLECHKKQGYKVGDIRGGISISFPAALYLKIIRNNILSNALIHFLILLAGITGLLVFFRKINSYYHVIKVKNAELTSINATRDKILSIIAHDLRSPFNTIIGLSDFIIEEAEASGNQSISLQAKTIRSASGHTYDLLENLLDWAQVQQGTIPFKPVLININRLTEKEISILQLSANKKGIELVNEIPANFSLAADEHMLSTIIRNLVSNAIKFSYRGGKVRIAISYSENQPRIMIIDNGIGMSGNEVNSLFQININFSKPGTENERGTGLGLTLCYEFAQKHGGSINIESSIGKGSTFIVTLPQIR